MNRVKGTLFYILISVLLFSFIRVMIFLLFGEKFSDLTLSERIRGFLDGIRFDFSSIATFVGIPILLLNLPSIRWKTWISIWSWIFYLLLVLMILIMASDVIYFSFLGRHISNEVLFVWSDINFIIAMLIEYKIYLILYILFCFALAFFWNRIRNILINCKSTNIVTEILNFVLLCLILFFGMRGGFSSKSINIADAFGVAKLSYANLVLNGIFSSYHSSKFVLQNFQENQNFYNFLSEEDAIETLNLKNRNRDFPAMMTIHSKGPHKNNFNLVVLLLESWTPRFIDSFGNANFKVTPNFDRLAKEGIKFTNFYSVGRRSIQGIQAVLTGVFPAPGLPVIGYGLELSKFLGLGHIADKQGYSTIMIQSSKRRSYRMNSISKATGFSEYYGMEDMPKILEYPSRAEPKFGWDYETLIFLKNKLDEIKKPFLAFVFTGTTHASFAYPGKKFEVRPHSTKSVDGYLNTLFYSDWSIGEFIESAKRTEWFDNTIFIFVADHPSEFVDDNDFREKFHIPCIIYAPSIFSPQVIDKIGSQLDIIPTIVDILGFDLEFSSLTNSIFKKQDNFAYVIDGNLLGIITDKGFLTHTLKNVVDRVSFTNPLDFEILEKNLLAMVQLTHNLVKANKWYK